MIIIEGFTGPTATKTLRTMFEDRKNVFVDLLGWDVPILDGRYEVDEFDTEHATYFIVADRDGDHLASARLLPTTRPGILGTLFDHLCAASPPTGAAVFEITRFCLSRRQNAAGRKAVRNQLVSALVWHALGRGIRTYTGVAEMAWLQQILAFGWNCRPLGAPVRLDCGLVGTLAIEIDENTPGLLAANGIWQPAENPVPVLVAA